MIMLNYRGLIESVAGGREVIIGNDNGPRPPKPYAAVFFQSARPQPVHRQFYTDDAGLRMVESHRMGRLQIHCYGKNGAAWELGDLIAMGILTEAAIQAAAALNIAWMSQPTLESIPALMDNSEYEDRAILTIETAYTGFLAEDVSFIQTVEVDVETEPSAMGPETITITVA